MHKKEVVMHKTMNTILAATAVAGLCTSALADEPALVDIPSLRYFALDKQALRRPTTTAMRPIS